MTEELKAKHLKVTNYTHGPFALVVTDLENPEDSEYPMIIASFEDKKAAVAYVEHFAKRKQPYLGLHFAVTQILTPDAFGRYCSWEE